ncbi:MAG: hypothetical protein AAB214_21570 [Fibrobacterota bacterium]
MNLIACKFGGTSLADATQFKKVASIVRANAGRRAVVVSAPGKRNKQDPKITDILLSIHDLVSRELDPDPSFALLRERFLEIERELAVDAGMAACLKAFQISVLAGADRDWIASRGEHFSARIMAAYLGGTFVEPEGAVFLTANGLVDDKTWTELPKRLPENGIAVMPGFYGTGPHNKVKTFSRGTAYIVLFFSAGDPSRGRALRLAESLQASAERVSTVAIAALDRKGAMTNLAWLERNK